MHIPLLIVLFIGLLTPQTVHANDDSAHHLLSGTFVIADVRFAGDVAGGPIDASIKTKIGKEVSFGESLSWWDGSSCKNWRIKKLPDLFLNLNDPVLSDTQIGPVDGPQSTGDKTVNIPSGKEGAC